MSTARSVGADVPSALVGRAVLAFALGCGVVVAALLLLYSGGEGTATARAIDVAGATLVPVRGQGERVGTTLVLTGSADGVAIASAPVEPFAAADHPRITWQVRSPGEPDDVTFVFRTRENPARTFAIPLAWVAGGTAPLHAAAHESWRGTIIGIGIAVRGKSGANIEIAGVRFASGAPSAMLVELLQQWRAIVPLKGYSVAFPFDTERAQWLPLVQALGLATVIGIGVAALHARLRRRRFDARVVWLVLALAWLVQDARWTTNLAMAAADAHARYAGKTTEEKWLAGDDAALYALARTARAALPDPPARVLILSERPLLAARLAHFLAPHNTYAPLRLSAKRDEASRPPPDVTLLRSGDYLFLFLYRQLAFDPAGQALVWPDGRRRGVTPLLQRDDALLVRVQ